MPGLTALTKLEILDLCKEERTWGEIKHNIHKSSSTISVHITDLLLTGLLSRKDHIYKTTKKGKEISKSLKQLQKTRDTLEELVKVYKFN